MIWSWLRRWWTKRRTPAPLDRTGPATVYRSQSGAYRDADAEARRQDGTHWSNERTELHGLLLTCGQRNRYRTGR